MPKPTLPTQKAMRDHCRITYGHYSNLSREWLKLQTTPAERVASYGYAKIDRDMAEVWEAVFSAMPEAQQDTYLDWYIGHYRGAMYDSHGDSKERSLDPNREDPAYGLAGYSVGWWTPDTCDDRRCKVKVMNATPGGTVDVWSATVRTCTAHSATGQTLLDAIYGENGRKNTTLAIVESTISDVETTTWRFLSTRIGATDERVLEVTIAQTSKPQRDGVKDATALMFGTDAVVVL